MAGETKKAAEIAKRDFAQDILNIKISSDIKRIEAQETDYKNVSKWAIASISSGLLSQGIMGIGFVSLVIFLGVQSGLTYFWSFVSLTIALGISNFLTLILGLLIGSISDVYGKRKQLVLIFSGISFVLFAAIASWMNFYFTIILFILGNTLFQTSRIVFNAQVPFVADVKNRGTVNGLSGVFHFIGTLIAVIIVLIMLFTIGSFSDLADIQAGLIEANEIQFGGIRWIFPICAFLMVLSLIPYSFIKEKRKGEDRLRDENGKFNQKNILNKTFDRMNEGINDLLKKREFRLFLAGWFFVSVSLTIVSVFYYEIIKKIIVIDEWVILLIILTIALAAILSAFVTGIFIDELGPKVSISFTIMFAIIGVVVTLLAGYQRSTTIASEDLITVKVLSFDWWIVFIGAFFLGLALGGFWVIGKQFVIELAPTKKLGQAFGYMNIINQLGAVIGTLFFYGLITYLNDFISDVNSYRAGLIIILGLLIISIIFFMIIRDLHARYLIGERAPYKKIQYKIKRKSKKLNFFVRIIIRLEYINQKFIVLLAAIKACGFFVMLVEFAFGIEQFPWYIFFLIVITALPLLITFVYVLEYFGESWRAENWAQFYIMQSKIVEDQVKYNMLKNVIAFRMDEEEKNKKLDQSHQRLGLMQQRIRIEYEILQEVKKLKEKE